MRKNTLFLAAAALAVLPAARAQMPGASQQVDALQQRRLIEQSAQSALATNTVPELYPEETSDVGPQSVVKMKPRRTWLEAFGDEQIFYTDNMFLADQGKVDTYVLVSTVQAAIAPTPFEFQDGLLAPRAGYQQQWFTYEANGSETVTVYDFNSGTFKNVGLSAFNFNASTVFGDVTWRRHNWQFTLGADFRRLLDSGDYSEFYREYVPRWSVVRDFPLTDTTAISLGYDGDYRVTETASPLPPGYGDNFNDRTDHSLFIVGAWQLCRHAVLQPSYRFQYTHYTATTRDDYLNSFGLTLYCSLTPNITLRGFVGYDNLNTDGAFVQNYDKLDAGAGLNLTVRF